MVLKTCLVVLAVIVGSIAYLFIKGSEVNRRRRRVREYYSPRNRESKPLSTSVAPRVDIGSPIDHDGDLH